MAKAARHADLVRLAINSHIRKAPSSNAPSGTGWEKRSVIYFPLQKLARCSNSNAGVPIPVGKYASFHRLFEDAVSDAHKATAVAVELTFHGKVRVFT